MPVLSVIVPVYKTEAYFERCINSLLNQTLSDIEIIVVNDGSPGKLEEICDERIKYINHDKNRGLFQARLTGAAIAKGKYIAFADSDDYVSIDFYRTLVEKGTDIAVGRTVRVDAEGNKYIHPFHDQEFITGENNLLKQQGLCYAWHTIWNKIYKKSLWDKCEPYYHYIQQHLVMTEDIAFSLPLMYFAKDFSVAQNDAYFYCDNSNAVTNTGNMPIERFQKNIADMKAVFDFGQWFLQKVEANPQKQEDFFEFRKHYSRLWRDFANNRYFAANKHAAIKAIDEFLPNYCEQTSYDDHFYGRVKTPWNSGLEDVKEQIANSKCHFISFDIFDTLVKRPLFNPDDLFYLMQKKFGRDFYKIRRHSEDTARTNLYKEGSNFQDVNLLEIYSTMQDEYDLSFNVCTDLMAEEVRLELQFAEARQSAKELYDVAKAIGKEIIIVSDMYLSRDIIEAILEKCGYSGYSRLFLSSEERLTKFNNGELFSHISNLLGTSNILHIGDNIVSDIENAKSKGFQTIYFPKAKDVFEEKFPKLQTPKSLALRTMLGLVINQYFDNPFISFNDDSDFNIDPYLMGLFPVGMHLVALNRWIFSYSYETICYLARDGYLAMKAHKLAARSNGNIPKVEYVHVSRKSLLPIMLKNRLDFYEMPIEIRNHNSKTLMEMLAFCSNNNDWQKILLDHKLLSEKNFINYSDFKKFIDVFYANIYDKEKHNQAVDEVEKYLHAIAIDIDRDNIICFDMGYSGRIQAAINDVCKNSIPVLFVHSDEQLSFNLRYKHNFIIHDLYGHTPKVSGLMREHILSSTEASCIGYKNGKVIFDDFVKSYSEKQIVKHIHQGALDFCEAFWQIFAEFSQEMDFRPVEASQYFENFMTNINDNDLQIFSSSYFEDTVYGGKAKINIAEHIKNHRPREHAVTSKNNKLEIIKRYLKNKPLLYKLGRRVYWASIKNVR